MFARTCTFIDTKNMVHDKCCWLNDLFEHFSWCYSLIWNKPKIMVGKTFFYHQGKSFIGLNPFDKKSHCLHILVYWKKTLHFIYHGLVTTVLVILFITITSKVQNYPLPWLYFIFFVQWLKNFCLNQKGIVKVPLITNH